MNRQIVFLTAGLCVASLCRAEGVPEKCPAGMDEDHFDFLVTEGGSIFKPNTGYGSFLFVNSQAKVPLAELEKTRDTINSEVFVQIRFAEKDAPAEIKTEIVDKPGEPALAIFPDEKRGVVNVAALAKDNPSAAVLAARTRKEMVRAFSYLGGLVGGGVPGEIMDVMTDMKRLDASPEMIPGDLVLRCEKFLARCGVKPYISMTYRDACQEGWAPKPKDVYQKKIWEKVHTPPSKPMKITYDKAAQKPVVK